MRFKSDAGSLINKISLVSRRIFNRLLRQADIDDLRTGQGNVLFALLNEDELSIIELCKKTNLKKSTMTTVIDRLENAGYVRRRPSETDRRVTNIVLTEKNKKLEDIYHGVSSAMTDIFFKGFSSVEIEDLEMYLSRILVNLTSYECGDGIDT